MLVRELLLLFSQLHCYAILWAILLLGLAVVAHGSMPAAMKQQSSSLLELFQRTNSDSDSRNLIQCCVSNWICWKQRAKQIILSFISSASSAIAAQEISISHVYISNKNKNVNSSTQNAKQWLLNIAEVAAQLNWAMTANVAADEPRCEFGWTWKTTWAMAAAGQRSMERSIDGLLADTPTHPLTHPHTWKKHLKLKPKTENGKLKLSSRKLIAINVARSCDAASRRPN